MIYALAIAAILIVVCIYCICDVEKRLCKLRDEFDCFRSEANLKIESAQNKVTFEQLKSEIKEYADLKGYTNFYRSRDYVMFQNYPQVEQVKLTDIQSSLAELKSVLEKNCPKKCVKKRGKA